MAAPKYGFRSLRLKLALTSTLVEIVMLALLIANSTAIATQALEDQTRYRVQEIVPLLNASLVIPLVERDYAMLDDILSQVVRKGGIEYLGISNEDQQLVAEVGKKPADYGYGNDYGYENDYGNGEAVQDIDDISSYRHLDVPLILAENPVGRLHLSIDTGFLQSTISSLYREGMLIAGGEVVLTFILLVLVGVLLTRNLAVLANAARSMTGGDFGMRVKIHSRDEIGTTARAFNAMAARLEASYNSLKRSEERYQTLAEVSPVGIFNTNAEGQCIYVNERYSEIAGLPQGDFLGEGWVEILHPDDRDQVIREWVACAAADVPYVGECRIVNVQGDIVWVYVQAVKTGFVEEGYVGTVTDISRLKTVELELAQHRDSLEGLVRERTAELEKAQKKLLRQERLATLGQLTATVSHELKNPLAVISNAVYFLNRKYPEADGHPDEKIAQYLEMIKREVAAADRIITDLLATSRTNEPIVQWVNLDELVESIVASSTIPAHILWQYQGETVPFMMRADPAQLTQVLRNLLDNAVQAIVGSNDNNGSICLTASECDGQYRLRFSDSGPGIEEDQREKVFEPLYTSKAKGNGLGLWISREIIHCHGGELTTAAATEKGAVFLIVLPRGQS